MRSRKAKDRRSNAPHRNGTASIRMAKYSNGKALIGDELQRNSAVKHCEGNAWIGAAWPGNGIARRRFELKRKATETAMANKQKTNFNKRKGEQKK